MLGCFFKGGHVWTTLEHSNIEEIINDVFNDFLYDIAINTKNAEFLELVRERYLTKYKKCAILNIICLECYKQRNFIEKIRRKVSNDLRYGLAWP